LARALLVGCGCRGRELGKELIADGWLVRGTSRDRAGLSALEELGIEGTFADPDRVDTVTDHVGDVAVVFWLLGSASGETDGVAALHDQRLSRLLEELVDTPVRGFVYEAAGAVEPASLERGAAIVRAASERWRIPVELVAADPGEPAAWVAAMAQAARRLIS
jgi:uncharacterized protein YbjT (DUF2867 family)